MTVRGSFFRLSHQARCGPGLRGAKPSKAKRSAPMPEIARAVRGALAPGKQADIIMVRTQGVAVFPVSNAIGTIVQAVERADVDTVMVAGQLRKRAGRLLGIDLARLNAEVTASRDYLIEASGYRNALFGAAA